MPSSSSQSSTTTLPAGHPPVPAHAHSGARCPVTGDTHGFCPPQEGDVRSVCPALNTMANHGYIPRDGKNLTFSSIFSGLKKCYGLSTPLAIVLTTGGFLLIKRSPIRIPFVSATNKDGTKSPSGVIDLHLIGIHGGVEHDASIVHLDTQPGALYPPTPVKEDWVGLVVGDIEPAVEGFAPFPNDKADRLISEDANNWKRFVSPSYHSTLVNAADVGRMRYRRQHEILPKKLDGVHAEIARGEMAIILGVWEHSSENSEKKGIPLPWLLTWLAEERLPEVESKDKEGRTMWRPNHVQGLLDVVKRSKAIRTVTEAMEKSEKS